MLHIQVLALTLIPLLSDSAPRPPDAAPLPPRILGVERRLTAEDLVGVWKYVDHFSRWGVTDKRPARVERYRGTAYMALRRDGGMKMVNLFQPPEGRWEYSNGKLILYDPKRPERGSRALEVRRRGDDSIWLLLPFSGGANGIGLVRAGAAEAQKAEKAEAGGAAVPPPPRRSAPRAKPESGPLSISPDVLEFIRKNQN